MSDGHYAKIKNNNKFKPDNDFVLFLYQNKACAIRLDRAENQGSAANWRR
jgi:hypothetical protein